MVLFYLCHHLKLGSDFFESFCMSLFCHALVHIGPLAVLTLSCCQEVLGCALYLAAHEVLEPQFGVFLLVGCCLLKDVGYLHITVFLGLAGKVGVLVAGLRFACECFPQILLGFCSFQFFHDVFVFNVNNFDLYC